MNQTPLPGRAVSITGTGSYLPAKILTNADLEKIVETTDEWILTRTGIRKDLRGQVGAGSGNGDSPAG